MSSSKLSPAGCSCWIAFLILFVTRTCVYSVAKDVCLQILCNSQNDQILCSYQGVCCFYYLFLCVGTGYFHLFDIQRYPKSPYSQNRFLKTIRAMFCVVSNQIPILPLLSLGCFVLHFGPCCHCGSAYPSLRTNLAQYLLISAHNHILVTVLTLVREILANHYSWTTSQI